MVTVLETQLPVTPAGKPVMVAAVAPVVVYVVEVIAVLMHLVCDPPVISEMVLLGNTVIEPVAVTFPQPPVSVIV